MHDAVPYTILSLSIPRSSTDDAFHVNQPESRNTTVPYSELKNICFSAEIFRNFIAINWLLSLPQQQHLFSTDSSSSGSNGKSSSNSSNDGSHTAKTAEVGLSGDATPSRLFKEAQHQKSLVCATGKNKSLVPYIGSVLVVPVQKPLFPGFSSMLYLKDEHLKTHFIQQFRRRLNAEYSKHGRLNAEGVHKDVMSNTEWIGLCMHSVAFFLSLSLSESVNVRRFDVANHGRW